MENGGSFLASLPDRLRIMVYGVWAVQSVLGYCLLRKCLGFDKSTLTHKILFIYKVHDITVLPLLLITLPLKLERIYHTILGCYIINPNESYIRL